MQQQHTQVGRDGIKPARVHDARARARGHAVIAVDGLPHEQHFSGQVRIIGARAGAGLNKRQPSAAIRPHRGRHDPGCAGKRRQRRRISGICHQQRPRGGSASKPCPDIRKPAPGPASEPDADARRHVISQIARHQPPDETGSAKHHNIQLTVTAHPTHPKDTRRRPYALAEGPLIASQPLRQVRAGGSVYGASALVSRAPSRLACRARAIRHWPVPSCT